MSAIVVDLSNHRTGSVGTEGSGGAIVIEQYDGNVYLTLRDEGDGSKYVDRTLDPDEATALAAALVHFAAEARR